MILQIMGLAFVVILLSNNAFAQTLHNRTLYEVVNQTSELEKNSQIDVGKSPSAIAVDEFTNTVYVANFGPNSVSVIDAVTNKVVAGIILHVNPFNSGYIECDRLISPTAQYFYILAG
jgi:YVTN family beta-propeller protein